MEILADSNTSMIHLKIINGLIIQMKFIWNQNYFSRLRTITVTPPSELIPEIPKITKETVELKH